MYQGQIARIVDRMTNRSGWYQKLRETSGVWYFKVGPSSIEAGVIPNDDVDESKLRDNHTKRYAIDLEVPASIQMEATHFQPMEDIETRIASGKTLDAISTELGDLTRHKGVLETQYEGLLRQMRGLDNGINDLSVKIRELEAARDQIQRGVCYEFTYAYGVHSGSPKEYCWRVPERYADLIGPGAEAVGETTGGQQPFTVTRVEKSPEFRQHKLVVRFQ